LYAAWGAHAVLPGVVPVPADGFRHVPIFAFPAADAEACFQTSGTTAATAGRHWFRTTQTYREVCLAFGNRALIPCGDSSQLGRRLVVALMSDPGPLAKSSLAFMAARFMESFDGGSLSEARSVADFSLAEPGRWLLSADGIDLEGLARSIHLATELRQPMLLLSTSFALVMLLDQLGERSLHLPPGSVLMTTGGFKGRTRELSVDELNGRAQELLQPQAIVSEYGMTELTSQLYEGLVPGAALQGPPGIYLEPPTLRVFPLDSVSLCPVPDGELGLACFVDLGNVDSAVCVLTQDLVRREGPGIRLLGRAPKAVLRGCSLDAEAIGLGLQREGDLERNVVRAGAAGVSAEVPLEKTKTDDVALTESIERVRHLIEAAKLLQDGEHPFGRELRTRLASSTDLSPEAIELGLQCSLETSVSDAELRQFCTQAEPAPRSWVVLSANVFVAAHRAIALALASSPEVLVRPSRREPVFAELLLRAAQRLRPSATAPFRIGAELSPRSGDAVFAYGSDSTMLSLHGSLPEGVRFYPHGSGFGAVIVYPEAPVQLTAQAIAADVVPFDQEGCLSPRIVLVPTSYPAEALAAQLATALREWANRVPRGRSAPQTQAEQRWYEGVARLGADVYEAGGSWIVLQQDPAQLLVPPTGRNLTLYQTESPERLVHSLGQGLTSLGVAGNEHRREALGLQLPGVRVCSPGKMQQPAFDGPVDRRGTGASSRG
jgi:hypothetical protein